MNAAQHFALQVVPYVRKRDGRDGTRRREKRFARAPDAIEKANAAGNAFVGPLHRVFGRRRLEQEEPHRVDARAFGRLVDADDVAAALRHLLAVTQHHALIEETRERFVGPVNPTLIVKIFIEEACVEQVQDGVLRAADVLVDVEPRIDTLRFERCAVVARIEIPDVVPRRFEKRIHGVAFASRRAAARRTRRLRERGVARERRTLARNRHVRR